MRIVRFVRSVRLHRSVRCVPILMLWKPNFSLEFQFLVSSQSKHYSQMGWNFDNDWQENVKEATSTWSQCKDTREHCNGERGNDKEYRSVSQKVFQWIAYLSWGGKWNFTERFTIPSHKLQIVQQLNETNFAPRDDFAVRIILHLWFKFWLSNCEITYEIYLTDSYLL